MDKHVIMDFSGKDRVFVAGDVHGEYSMLQEELAKQNFNEDRDMLVLVGDICDRGLENYEMLDFIDKPFVVRVIGNHDVALRNYLNGNINKDTLVRINRGYGATWLEHVKDKEIEAIAAKLENAPVAMTVITPQGRRVGVVHADCGSDWNYHISRLNLVWVYDLSIESRETWKVLEDLHRAGKPLDQKFATVVNIDHVFHGHTPIAVPLTCGNRSWIDTGACFGGSMSVLDIDLWLSTKQRYGVRDV